MPIFEGYGAFKLKGKTPEILLIAHKYPTVD